jgi:hypothetical protein
MIPRIEPARALSFYAKISNAIMEEHLKNLGGMENEHIYCGGFSDLGSKYPMVIWVYESVDVETDREEICTVDRHNGWGADDRNGRVYGKGKRALTRALPFFCSFEKRREQR